MGKNLVKAPLLAVFYAALIWFAAALLPYSQGYLDAAAGFSMPLMGFAVLVGYSLWVMAAVALAYSSRAAGGVRFLILLLVSMIGAQWAIPMAQAIAGGETTGAASRADLLSLLAGLAAATVLSALLSLFLYKNPERAAGKELPKQKYKVKIFGLVIRVIVLPVIFVVMYYLLWYFLLWQSADVRAFYGRPDDLGFMQEIINTLLDRGGEVVLVLIRGLAYALFALPLLTLLPGKRVMFLVVNAMLCGSGAIIFLIPSPLLPEAVRMPHLIWGAALLIPFGAIAGILLHTAVRREPLPEAAPDPKAVPAAAKPRRPAAAKAPAPTGAAPAAASVDKQA